MNRYKLGWGFSTIFAILFIPQSSWGLDCSVADIDLYTQAEVNDFQSTYGNGGTCDTITGFLRVGGDVTFPEGDIEDLDGLLDITEIRGDLAIRGNPHLPNVDGLINLTKVGGDLNISRNVSLNNIDGLINVTGTIGHLGFYKNISLSNIDGLANLTNIRSLSMLETGLTNIDGLASVTGGLDSLQLHFNHYLINVDGLTSLVSVDGPVTLIFNYSLASCEGLSRLLDQWDDAAPGPGPGETGVPDVGTTVSLGDNLTGCNSIEEIFADGSTSRINPGLNDAWYNPVTSGQGFFISVFPDLASVSLAWFTYDTELPPDDAQANLGDPGHRWLTAIGPIEGNEVLMNIEMASGGLFDTPTDIKRTDPPGSDGTILLTFDSCNSGTVEYDIPSINQQGTVPIQRVAGDNIALCEALNAN